MKDQISESPLTKLSNATLAELPSHVSRPSYDRSKLRPGIVHIGLGNFHRAHQAWYLHRLMEQGLAHDWAIIGAGVRPGDAAMREKLLAQDCLTTLIELDPSGTSVEIIGSMIDFLPVEETNAALIDAMADPAIRIVSLTITEGGYYLDGQGGFDADHPDIQHDAAHPDAPKTAFGAMVAALGRRRLAGELPFTGQCCDNLQGNGAVLRQTILGLAQLIDAELADWIADQMTFPDAMVDCIVPATGAAEREKSRQLGIDDAAPVTHENFRQWVIEDKFCAGRPPWEKAGVTITDTVHNYEAMKIRILNGGHQILANIGELLGAPTIAACMQDSDIKSFFDSVQRQEIAPHVLAVPGMTPDAYLELITDRFANPLIHDTTRRVAFDGSSRHPGFVLPVVRDALAANGPIDGLALAEALWARMCHGTREDGSLIEPNDPHWEQLNLAARKAKDEPLAWLQQTQFYGDLADDDRFAGAFADWLTLLWSKGARAAVHVYLDG
ncbi:MAG: mannitol dehydrogenase family protein [Boseongicola sp.]|nr:mannitol dehydrogenase family protein [Boseongicola sp.]MDD9977534.1 mannitol dehydrogenase family protein [Boseongicola sp.]